MMEKPIEIVLLKQAEYFLDEIEESVTYRLLTWISKENE
jgi:hypothetical protein